MRRSVLHRLLLHLRRAQRNRSKVAQLCVVLLLVGGLLEDERDGDDGGHVS
jgi:hypothetical protein